MTCPWHVVLSPMPEGGCLHPPIPAAVPKSLRSLMLQGALMSPDLLQPEFWNKDRDAALVSRGNAAFLISWVSECGGTQRCEGQALLTGLYSRAPVGGAGKSLQHPAGASDSRPWQLPRTVRDAHLGTPQGLTPCAGRAAQCCFQLSIWPGVMVPVHIWTPTSGLCLPLVHIWFVRSSSVTSSCWQVPHGQVCGTGWCWGSRYLKQFAGG